MRSYFLLLAIALLAGRSGISQTYQFNNGNWWINGQFKALTVYTENGNFTFKKPKNIDSVIDLGKQYCIPPFGDAHTHNLDGTNGLRQMILRYLNEGVMYVQVLGNYGAGAVAARKQLAQTNTLEATYANGLLTATYGHGFYPYEPLAMGIYAPADQIKRAEEIKKSRIAENNAYYFFDSIPDVEAKWPMIMRFKPDHLKICLLDAANYTANRKAELFDGYGLSAEVAAYVVAKAHKEGLRVFAHVETAEDARLCARIGVDALAHMPGYAWNGKEETREKYCMTVKDIDLFKKAGLTIIPTMNIDHSMDFENGAYVYHPDRKQRTVEYETSMLRALYQAKVPIALGGDYYSKTVEPEIDSLIAHKVFTPAELIEIWGKQTVQHIYPKRKLGEIREGYEASFLLLSENPLKDIQAIRRIKLLFKNGRFL